MSTLEMQTPRGNVANAALPSKSISFTNYTDKTAAGQASFDHSPEFGKAAAVSLFNFDVLSMVAVDRMFAAHPAWRAA